MKKIFLRGLLAAALTITAVFTYVYYDYGRASANTQAATVYFERGSGFEEIVDELAAQNVIQRPLLFKAQAALTGKYRLFKPGEYEFFAAMSPKAVMDTLVAGRRVVHKLTVPEGLESDAVLKLLNEEPYLTGEVPERIAEGSVLPETYHFERGDARSLLLERMQQGMQDALERAWKNRKADLPLNSKEEALTLASIIEKETGLEAERRRIAAVYVNRLKKGIKLQADPTTIYAIKVAEGALNRPLVIADLKRDLPYNTYMQTGLPPGPICNPGKASIEAAVNPLDTDELFFVASGGGGHYFASSLKEHNANVAKYRQLQRSNQPSNP